MDDGPPHHTTVLSEINKGTTEIEIREGLPSAAAVENIVQVFDYSEPATDDVEQILATAEGWEVVFGATGDVHGTEDGTSHAPHGESAWELLTATAEQSGEQFRVGLMLNGTTPRKRLFWFRQFDSSGMTLYLRVDNEDVAADTENINAGVIHSLERERNSDEITRIYPISGDGRIDLEYCTPGALAEAALQGFTVVVSTDLFRPDYVEYGPGVTAHGVMEGVFRFSNVTLPRKASLREMQSAADAMLKQAMTAIKESQTREYWRAVVHCHRPLYPGQSVVVQNTTGLHPIANATYYILEVREMYEKGVIKSAVLLSTAPQLQPDGVRRLGQALKAAAQEARRKSIIEDGGTATTVVSGSGGGSGHTDLAADDHLQYLRTDGTRTLVGNLAVAAGATIDGVDISQHAALPDAHHARVTAYDSSIEVVGEGTQWLRVAQAFAGAGLSLSESGVASVNVAAAAGTTITGDTVGVATEGAGGLEVGSAGARIKRPTHSGIALDETGAYLLPNSISSTSVNGNSGVGHTHAAVAYADTKAAPGNLMKASPDGDHTLRYLTADKVRTPLIDTASGGLRVEPAGALLDVKGDLRFTGGARSIWTETGSLGLWPKEELIIGSQKGVAQMASPTTLKSAHWASGFLGVGWGMTYDGALDCRSIYADEMRVTTFIADAARVSVGSHYVTPGMGIVAEPFEVPGVSGNGTLVLEDAPGLPNWPVFDNNDWVLMRVVDRSGGGLKVANVWGQVSGYQDGPGDGQQRWTFTTRNTTAPGAIVAGGEEALGFAKPGAAWWWVTTNDTAGSPYAGISRWWGDNPYTAGNREHVLRMGQLRGVTGVFEMGLFAGQAGGRRFVMSDVSGEMHGMRHSLYAGDGAQLRVGAVDVRLYRDASNYSTLTPNGDGTALGVVSGGSGYFGQIDESPDNPNYADYVANGLNGNGMLTVLLSEPSPWGAIHSVTVRVATSGTGFVNDSIRLMAQVVAADEVTPLTGEVEIVNRNSNVVSVISKTLPLPDTAATQSQWSGARLRLRWQYAINQSDEAIRLDPQVPSIAVGRGLPTGYEGGGDGFWVGADAGLYKMRLGKAAGVGLRWTGAAIELRNSANAAVIELDSSGNSRFAGPMTLGTAGGIWQGSGGTFAAPVSGFRLSNSGGKGRIEMFPATGSPVVLDENGLSIPTRQTAGSALKNVNEIAFLHRYLATDYKAGGLTGYGEYSAQFGRSAARLYVTNKAGTQTRAYMEVFHYEEGAANTDTIELNAPGLIWLNGARIRTEGPVEATYTVRTSAGMVVGQSNDIAGTGTPPSGVLRFVERAGLPTVPGGYADLYVGVENGVQGLYIKFAGKPAVKIV